jgi:hypothetical protein
MLVSLGALSVAFAVLMCVHVVRTGNQMYWIFIILALQPFGGIIYGLTMVLPEMIGGSTARRATKAVKDRLDPTRAYRDAKTLYDDAPTPGNVARFAQTCADIGRHDEAEALYAEAAQGIHKDDAAFLLGRAEALVELGRNAEALEILNRLGDLGEKGRTARAALLMGRAHHALGQWPQADDAYGWAAQRYAGLEASARYAVFLQESGRADEARTVMADLDKRLAKTQPHFRREARTWRDFAAATVAQR